MLRTLSLSVVLLFINTAWLAADSAKFVELVESGKPYQGKVVARSKDYVWLMERTGTMHSLGVGNITQYRKLSDSFSAMSAADLRDQLRRELGGEFDVVGTGHYLVAGPPGLVRNYAEIFEDQYRAIYSYFSIRGLDVHDSEFPLVAIVFPDAGSFAKYAMKDQILASAGLKGYYIQSSNRIALFHETPKATSMPRRGLLPGGLKDFERSTIAGEFPGPVGRGLGYEFPLRNRGLDVPGDSSYAVVTPRVEDLRSTDAWATTDGDLQSTMIHETTHQVAFNIGIHSRIGNVNPRWVVEGLATTFEAPGMRSTSLANTPGAKLNTMRLEGFREFVKKRRAPKSLTNFVKSDLAFGRNVLDGYAQAWALSYYLIETRPREYAKFIKMIISRPPLETYEDEQRLADFKSAFGSDLVLFEAKFLRHMSELK